MATLGPMPPARWLARAAALLFLCAAPLFAPQAVADSAPAGTAPPATAAPGAAATAQGPAPGATAATVPAAAPVEAAAIKADDVAEAPSAAPAASSTASSSPATTAKTPSKPPKKRRGGIHPCMTPDPGFGAYDTWSRAPSMGQMIAPKSGGVRKDGGFDLVIHFHGHEPIRKEFVKTSTGVVLVGIDLGIGSGAYQTAFAAPSTYTKLVASVEAEMARRSGNPKAHVRKLALSSWSAGYGAIEQILRQTGGKNIDAVILLDSLHAGYENEQAKTLKVAQIEPFIAFAKRAAAGKTFMYMSHSSIIPPGYASTTEVTSYVVKQLGGKPVKAKREDVLGLDMIRKYDKSNFHLRGYDGDDKPDHCAHIGLIAGVMKAHIQPRWKTPQTKTNSPKQPAAVKTPGVAAKKSADKAAATTTAKADATPAKTAPAPAKTAPAPAKTTTAKKTGAPKKVASKDDKSKKKKP